MNILVHDLQIYQKIETMSDKDVFAEYEKLYKAAKRMRKRLGISEKDDQQEQRAAPKQQRDSTRDSTYLETVSSGASSV